MSTKKIIITGAAGLALAASGAIPALAHGLPHAPGHTAGFSVGQKGVATRGRVVGGSISTISGTDLTIERKAHRHATTTPATITVHTSVDTVVSKDGQKVTLADLALGQMAIISGTKQSDGSVDASRIFVRTKASAKAGPFWHSR